MKVKNQHNLKKLYRIIKKYILQELSKPEAPKDALFGQWFAPEKRKLDIPTEEPNTEKEQEAEEAIDDYVNHNQKDKLEIIAPTLLDLARQNLYPLVLSAKEVTFVYRIIMLPNEAASKLIGKQITGAEPAGVAPAGTVQSRKSKITGWTADINLVKEFGGMSDGNTLLLFKARTEGNRNNFFGNPGNLALVAGSPYFVKEKEVIAYGPVNYDIAAYVMLYDDNNHYYDAKPAVDKIIELINS